MNRVITSKLRPFTPPIVLELVKRISRQVISFSGEYATWQAASAASVGYDSLEILRRVVAATRKVVAGEAPYERDSVLFDQVEYSWPLLASLLQVALETGSLRVVDFGGALGSTWRQNRKYLERLSIPCVWHVVEQQQFVAAGKAEFETAQLRFDATIADASIAGVDAVLFCGSLSYVPDPDAFLRQAAATSARYLIIDRLPVISGGKDRITVQSVHEPIYEASYPIRLFAEQMLIEQRIADWRVIERWECDLQPHAESRLCGFFLERR